MPLSELVSSSCSNSAQSAYFRSQSSQTSGNCVERSLRAQEAPGPRKIRFRARGSEKREAESHSDSLGGDARSRRVSHWSAMGSPSKDRRPGSTDCPGRVLWKPESRFEAEGFEWSGVSMMLIGLPIEQCHRICTVRFSRGVATSLTTYILWKSRGQERSVFPGVVGRGPSKLENPGR